MLISNLQLSMEVWLTICCKKVINTFKSPTTKTKLWIENARGAYDLKHNLFWTGYFEGKLSFASISASNKKFDRL